MRGRLFSKLLGQAPELGLGQAFGNGAWFWMALQTHYVIWKAERSSRINIERLRWNSDQAA